MRCVGRRLGLGLLAVLVAVMWLAACPAAALSATVVKVDNQEANSITKGEVIDSALSDPGEARIAVHNNFSFWTAIRVLPSSSGVVLKPTSPAEHLNGFWAMQSLLPPKSKAVYDATFDSERYSAQSIQVYYGLSTPGVIAMDLNVLEPALLLLSAGSAALGKPLVVASKGALVAAAKLLTEAPEWMDFFATFQEGRAHTLQQATILTKLLGSGKAQAQLQEALANVGIAVEAAKLAGFKFAWDVVWGTVVPTYDLVKARVLGQMDGIVTFSSEERVPTSTGGPSTTVPKTAPTPGTPGDMDLIETIQSFWSGVDIFLPSSLPAGWRLAQKSDSNVWGEYRESNPDFIYIIMTTDHPGGYSLLYTDGRDSVEMSVSYFGAGGWSREYAERAQTARQVGISFEGEKWAEFRYEDDDRTDPDHLFIRLANETSNGPWVQPGLISLTFDSLVGREAALALAGSMFRIPRAPTEAWVLQLVDQIRAVYRETVCLPSSLPSGWHVASPDEIATATGVALGSSPTAGYSDLSGEVDYYAYFSDGRDLLELVVNVSPVDVLGDSGWGTTQLDVEFVGIPWRLPDPAKVQGAIIWESPGPPLMKPMTLVWRGQSSGSLEMLLDFARRIRAY